jgi:hypothetical protein
MQFSAPGVAGAPSSQEAYKIFSAAGRRTVPDGTNTRDAASLHESTTELLTSINAPGTVLTGVAPNGLQIGWVRSGIGDASTTPNYYAVGFFTTFSRYVDASRALGGIRVVPIKSSAPNQAELTLVDSVRAVGAMTDKDLNDLADLGTTICIQNSAGSMHAFLDLGGNLRQQSSDMNIKNGGC